MRAHAADPKPTAATPHRPSSVVQRQCACGSHAVAGGECEACKQKRPASHQELRNGDGQGPKATGIGSLTTPGGRPLESGLRAQMEHRFDHDFSGVRVHTDDPAGKSAEALRARAYTVGRSIIFAQGAFAPQSRDGQKLIAHELTHVVQNDAHPDSASRSKLISEPGDPSEREAHGMARQIAARAGPRTAPAALVQRDDTGTALGVAGGILGAGLLGLGIAYLAGAFDKKKPDAQQEAKQPEPGSPEAIAREQAGQRPLISFEDALKEGSATLKPAFGKTYGQSAGPDPRDGYDASEWTEVQESPDWQEGMALEETGRHYIEAKGNSSWVALKHMFANFGKPVPKAGGGTTSWRFDCFEFVEILHLYARWRSMPAKEFDKRFPKLRIGFFTKAGGEWQTPFKIDAPKGKPYQLGEMKTVIRRNARGEELQTYEPEKTVSSKSAKKLVDEAPVGTQVIWTNLDAQNKCRTDRNLHFCESWQSENTTKLGPDLYNAFPLGEMNEASIKLALAKEVVDPVPPGYIEKNIFVSAIFYPTAAPQPAPPAGGSSRGR